MARDEQRANRDRSTDVTAGVLDNTARGIHGEIHKCEERGIDDRSTEKGDTDRVVGGEDLLRAELHADSGGADGLGDNTQDGAAAHEAMAEEEGGQQQAMEERRSDRSWTWFY